VKFNFRKFLKFIGPGFLVCMAYLDPGNLSGDMGVGLSG
jgi:Mn2+/Fe2+ NRAMP family transporter